MAGVMALLIHLQWARPKPAYFQEHAGWVETLNLKS
jgi:hypothetical protein